MALSPRPGGGGVGAGATLPTRLAASAIGLPTSPPAVPPTEVTFTWRHGGVTVYVAGTFNGWQWKKLELGDSGEPTARVRVNPGRYQYKFIVDSVWKCDPECPHEYDTDYNLNNVVNVFAPSPPSSPSQYRKTVPPSGPATTAGRAIPQDVASLTRMASWVDKLDRRYNVNSSIPFGVAIEYRELEDTQDSGSLIRWDLVHAQFQHMSASLFWACVTTEIPELDPASPVPSPPEEPTTSAYSHPSLLDSSPSDTPDLTSLQSVIASSPIDGRVMGDEPLEIDRDLERLYAVRCKVLEEDPRAAFNPQDRHLDITLACANHLAIKNCESIHRSVRAALHIPTNRNVYYEIHFEKQCSGGGICVGLSTQAFPLNSLVGSQPHTIGLYSTGNLLVESHWSRYGPAFGEGTTIGVLVNLREEQDTKVCHELVYLLNGRLVDAVPAHISFPKDAHVYPTVSLYSRGTRVKGCFTNTDKRYHVEMTSDVFALDGKQLTRTPPRETPNLRRCPSRRSRLALH